MIRRIISSATSVIGYQDNVGRIHFRPTADTSRLAESFRGLQAKLLRRQITTGDLLAELALVLVSFEAIVTPDDLAQAIMAATNAYRHDGRLAIEWKREDKRQDRRFVSSLIRACIEALPSTPPTELAAKQAIAAAAVLAFPNSTVATDELFRAATSWVYESLPGVLFGHVTGLAPLCALPRSTLARHATGLALAVTSEMDSTASEVIGEAMDRFFQQCSTTGSAWVITELEQACTRRRNVPRHRNKRDMLLQCQLLCRKICEADSLSALLVAWAADLIESGTQTKPDIHPGTVHKYVRYIAMQLHLNVKADDILDWAHEDFEECYRSIVASAPAGKQGNTASALSSWHAFLVRWLDVPPLRIRLHKDAAEPLPAANVIWPHEKLSIVEWLNKAAGDERLEGQLKVAVEIAWGGRIRANELLRTRLHNIRFYPDLVEIEVAPMIRDGKPKSKSGLRVLTYKDPDAQAVIRAWHVRRQSEGALSSDFLFGDPHQPERLYRLGSLYMTLNQLSKTATGDPTVSLHTWGHTWISTRLDDALCSRSSMDIDPLDVIATDAGHLSGVPTVRHYSHIYERALRHHIDLCLRTVEVSSREASHWAGVSPVALRQRTFARRVPAQTIYWDAIEARPLLPSILSADAGFSTSVPVSPLTSVHRKDATLEDVILAIQDIAAGMDQTTVGLRSRRGEAWVTRLQACMLTTLSRIVRLPRQQHRSNAALQDSIAAALQLPRHAIDFSRIDQMKFAGLRKALTRLDGERARLFATTWERCYSGAFISLMDGHVAGRLFAELAAAEIPRDQVAFSIATSTGTQPDGAALAHESVLQLAFRKAYKLNALVEYKSPRRGRPARYLMWSSTTLGERQAPASAALSIAGYNALMLALSTYLELTSREAEQDE